MSPPVDGPGQAATEPWPFAAYVAAFVAYVALGLLTKSWVLNWIVGPLFLLVVLFLFPRGLRRLRGRPR